jgi:2-polyprenyl-3-methyl-5-hydroxy-6-metoxy-1,4-benzoquinol methylase
MGWIHGYQEALEAMTPSITDLKHKPDGYYDYDAAPMLNYIPPAVRRVLEFGCAKGNFSALIKQRFGADCWGVEICREAARMASQKLDRVICGDATESLPQLPNHYFDCIVFNDVLEHLVDPFSLLIAVKEKLTENGVVVASIPNVRYWKNLKKLVLHGRWDYEDAGILDKTHLRFFTYKSLVTIFAQLEYEVCRIEGMRPTSSRSFRRWNFLSFNRLWDARYMQFACVVRPSEGRGPAA